MANKVNDSVLLIHELQLGERLNETVHNKQRSEFSLLLAMLTDDVRAHSQFTLPKSVVPQNKTTEQRLRKSFDLPDIAPLSIKNIADINGFNQAHLIENNQLEALHLNNALKPKAIAFRDNAKHIHQDVLTNTSLYCQQKYNEKSSDLMNGNRLDFNAKAWLDGVQTAIVKAPLREAFS